jgi:hypothetical protein
MPSLEGEEADENFPSQMTIKMNVSKRSRGFAPVEECRRSAACHRTTINARPSAHALDYLDVAAPRLSPARIRNAGFSVSSPS